VFYLKNKLNMKLIFQVGSIIFRIVICFMAGFYLIDFLIYNNQILFVETGELMTKIFASLMILQFIIWNIGYIWEAIKK